MRKPNTAKMAHNSQLNIFGDPYVSNAVYQTINNNIIKRLKKKKGKGPFHNILTFDNILTYPIYLLIQKLTNFLQILLHDPTTCASAQP